MAGLYLDTSALGRVLLAEPDAPAIADVLGEFDAWWSSALLVVELRRLAARAEVQDPAERMLAGVQVVRVDVGAVERASRILPWEVRSLDAIHLEAAVALHARGEVAAVLTYDRQLAAGCAHHDLSVRAPTA